MMISKIIYKYFFNNYYMNSRQKRKLRWDKTHEAPIKSYWTKTSEFGTIPHYKDGNIKGLLSELRTYGLISKHSGSQKTSKIKATLNRYRPIWSEYKRTMEALNASRKESEKIEDAEIISEPINIENATN